MPGRCGPQRTFGASAVRLGGGGSHPNGFEWCVNAIAVDSRGVAYANSEDGNLYAIGQGGVLVGRIFLHQAIGAAYTPTSIGPDGRIYTQNDGNLFVITENPKRRAVKQK
jgi:outer membrane protein assembly factor BamB